MKRREAILKEGKRIYKKCAQPHRTPTSKSVRFKWWEYGTIKRNIWKLIWKMAVFQSVIM